MEATAGSGGSSAKLKPKDPWKYIEPKDLSLGYYQLSHTDATHDPKWRPEGNASPVVDPDPTPSAPIRPPVPSSSGALEEDDLVFTGVNCTPVLSSNGFRTERENSSKIILSSPRVLLGSRSGVLPWSTRHSVSVHCRSPICNEETNVVPQANFSSVLRSQTSAYVPAQANQNPGHTTGIGSSRCRTNGPEINSYLPHCSDSICATITTWSYLFLIVVGFYLRCIVREFKSCLGWLYSSIYFCCVRYFLLGTMWIWILYQELTTIRTKQTLCTRHKIFSCGGFPAKWLILTTVMFCSHFINGYYFHIFPITNFIITKYGQYFLLASVLSTASVKSVSAKTADLRKISSPIPPAGNIDESSCFTHLTNDISSTAELETLQLNTAGTVFVDPGLELLTPVELQANMATQLVHPVIFDTGASLAITGCQEDFLPHSYKPITTLKLGGMAAGAAITGVGDIAWTFACDDGNQLTLMTKCYHVPAATTRLLSPQRLFDKQNGHEGKYWGDEDMFHLEYKSKPVLSVPYAANSNLPIGYACTVRADDSNQANLALLSVDNQNLTVGQKLLLEYHYKFGHTNMPLVQQILRTEGFPSHKFAAASKCALPKCAICEFAKAHRRPTHGNKSTPNEERRGTLKINDLRPGTTVSVDHFESRLKGRTFDSFGKATSDQYIGGCIFVDHASGYVHIEFQLGFSAIETIRAKQNFEKFAFDNGVTPLTYLTDSGAFKANKFVTHIRDHNQKIQYCGTNAHHQNGVAERAIRTISNMARAMILHSSAHWKQGIDPSMWPMAVKYASYLYNHLPRSNEISPSDVFFGSRVPRHKLRNLHVWGCPVYVLHPSLQAGKKIPRWEPRSTRGIFCGLSNIHSSEVPQVLNLATGSITILNSM